LCVVVLGAYHIQTICDKIRSRRKSRKSRSRSRGRRRSSSSSRVYAAGGASSSSTLHQPPKNRRQACEGLEQHKYNVIVELGIGIFTNAPNYAGPPWRPIQHPTQIFQRGRARGGGEHGRRRRRRRRSRNPTGIHRKPYLLLLLLLPPGFLLSFKVATRTVMWSVCA
jgi:hypothetical protein